MAIALIGFVLLSAVVCDGRKILLMSDLHYDMFYSTERSFGKCTKAGLDSYGMIGCDSPLLLLESAFDDMRSFASDVNMTIFTGDWLRHRMHQQIEAAPASVATVAALLGELPGHVMTAPTVASLGNNDFPRDYYFNYTAPPTDLMKHFTNEMANHSLLRTINETTSFLKCGYYHRSIDSSLDVLVLNTLLWSEALSPNRAPVDTDPCGCNTHSRPIARCTS